jgi:phosphoribosylglycinamide formyltransferase 2
MSKIGTALTPNATRVMLLGSGELGKELVIAFQKLGVETIAVDRYDCAPAMQVAHTSHTIDMSNANHLRALIEKERPDFVIPEIEAIATKVLDEIEQIGCTKIVPTARAVRLTMDREGIRHLAANELHIPTSRFSFCSSEEDLRQAIEATISYPCFVKPVMSSSGKGQSKVICANEIAPAWQAAMAGARVGLGRVIVEGFIDFDFEITLLTVRAKNSCGQTHTYFCEPIGHRQVDGDYVESWQPQAMSDTALQSAQKIAKDVCENLTQDTTGNALGLGLFGVEFFVKGDSVWFSEVSPRPHDTGLVTLVTQRQSEFDLHARAILGLPVDTRLNAIGASAVIYGELNADGVAFNNIAAALSVPQSELRLFGKPKSFLKRRMGVALAAADSTDVARCNARSAAKHVVVTK